MQNKNKAALEFFKNGESYRIDDLRLGFDNNGAFQVIGWSQYFNLKNLTKEIALLELKEIKDLFFKMTESSKELRMFLTNRQIIYTLCFDDYGKASINICSEIDDVLKWEIDDL